MAKYNWDQVQDLLKRATQIDSPSLNNNAFGNDVDAEMVSSKDIHEIAREAGISPEAIRKAIEEDRANALAEVETESTDYSESSDITALIQLAIFMLIVGAMSTVVWNLMGIVEIIKEVDLVGTKVEKIERSEDNTRE